MTDKSDDRLEERLLLRSAVAFEFSGLVDGIGFHVRVDQYVAGEFWGLVRHYGTPHERNPAVGMQVCVLVEYDLDGELAWVPWDWSDGFLFERSDSVWSIKNIECEREALTLALDICDGKTRPREPNPFVTASPPDDEACDKKGEA